MRRINPFANCRGKGIYDPLELDPDNLGVCMERKTQPCPICLKRNWNPPQMVPESSDETSPETCLFHNTSRSLHYPGVDFKEKVFERIAYCLENDCICILSGIKFDQFIDFRIFEQLPPIDFSYCKFTEGVSFTNNRFSNKAQTSFEFCFFEWIKFENVTFNGSVSGL